MFWLSLFCELVPRAFLRDLKGLVLPPSVCATLQSGEFRSIFEDLPHAENEGLGPRLQYMHSWRQRALVWGATPPCTSGCVGRLCVGAFLHFSRLMLSLACTYLRALRLFSSLFASVALRQGSLLSFRSPRPGKRAWCMVSGLRSALECFRIHAFHDATCHLFIFHVHNMRPGVRKKSKAWNWIARYQAI
eukprot:scaffold196779_cov28-Tisochrysis_lutea.AAC.3